MPLRTPAPHTPSSQEAHRYSQRLRSFHIPLGPESVVQLSLSDPVFSCCLLCDLPMTKTELHNPVTGPQGAHLHPSIRRHHVLWSLLSGGDKAREIRQEFGSGRHGVSTYRFWLSPKMGVWGSGCPSRTLGPQRTPWPRSLMAGERPWGAALGSDACHRHVCAARRAPSRRTASRCDERTQKPRGRHRRCYLPLVPSPELTGYPVRLSTARLHRGGKETRRPAPGARRRAERALLFLLLLHELLFNPELGGLDSGED